MILVLFGLCGYVWLYCYFEVVVLIRRVIGKWIRIWVIIEVRIEDRIEVGRVGGVVFIIVVKFLDVIVLWYFVVYFRIWYGK